MFWLIAAAAAHPRDPPCHPNATGTAGHCICRNGLIGDGVRTCARPVPIIESLDPNHGVIPGGYPVTIRLASNYRSDKAFCRFGSAQVAAEVSGAAVVVCIAPAGREGTVPVTVSFDEDLWSPDAVDFHYVAGRFNAVRAVALLLFCAFVVSMALLLLWVTSKGTGIEEEHLPLNKWHIGQDSAVGQEKGFLDFIVNITVN